MIERNTTRSSVFGRRAASGGSATSTPAGRPDRVRCEHGAWRSGMRIGVRLLRTSPVRRTLTLPGPPALDALWRQREDRRGRRRRGVGCAAANGCFHDSIGNERHRAAPPRRLRLRRCWKGACPGCDRAGPAQHREERWLDPSIAAADGPGGAAAGTCCAGGDHTSPRCVRRVDCPDATPRRHDPRENRPRRSSSRTPGEALRWVRRGRAVRCVRRPDPPRSGRVEHSHAGWVTHRFHIGCHGLWEAELTKRRVLKGEPRRAPALETVVIRARIRPEGLCLPCLSDACELPIDVVSAVVTELQEVVNLRLQGTCPVCRDDRLLVRF